VANIAESKRTHKQLAGSANAMHVAVFLMRSKHLSVHREAARIVSNMLSSTASHRLFLDDGGLISLFRLCRSLDLETLLNCALIYRKLSPILANHEFMIAKGCLAPLLILMGTQDLGVRQQSAAAMRDLASNLNFKSTMAEEGCLKRAIELGKDDDLQLRIIGLGTLRHLSINTRVKRPIVLEGGLGPIYMAVEDETQDLDLLRQAAAILSNISENGENQVSLIKEECLPRLIHLGNISHPEIQQDVAKCYASLTANPENHVGVFGSVEIKSILHLSNSKCFINPIKTEEYKTAAKRGLNSRISKDKFTLLINWKLTLKHFMGEQK
jgi:hypothetical protein